MRIPFSYYVQIACGMKNVSYRKHLTIPLWRHEDVILEFYETKPIFSKMIVKWTVCKLKYSLLGYTSCFHFLSYFSNTVLILKKDEEGNSTTWAYYTTYHRQISSSLFTWGLVQESAQFMGSIQEDELNLFWALIYILF
jgi:hypothetical protein